MFFFSEGGYICNGRQEFKKIVSKFFLFYFFCCHLTKQLECITGLQNGSESAQESKNPDFTSCLSRYHQKSPAFTSALLTAPHSESDAPLVPSSAHNVHFVTTALCWQRRQHGVKAVYDSINWPPCLVCTEFNTHTCSVGQLHTLRVLFVCSCSM